jgi:hypothetical protein
LIPAVSGLSEYAVKLKRVRPEALVTESAFEKRLGPVMAVTLFTIWSSGATSPSAPAGPGGW